MGYEMSNRYSFYDTDQSITGLKLPSTGLYIPGGKI